MIWAKVQFQFEGLHHYPNAPQAVCFLRDLHRHMFHVTVWVQQFHSERDVEYLMFRNWCRDQVQKEDWALTSSCEHIATTLVRRIQSGMEDYRNRRIKVEVTEDGENGALVES